MDVGMLLGAVLTLGPGALWAWLDCRIWGTHYSFPKANPGDCSELLCWQLPFQHLRAGVGKVLKKKRGEYH